MENWKKIQGFENYSVSDMGRVRRDTPGINTYAGRILKLSKIGKGYSGVGLARKKTYYVHIFVAKAFIPNPENKPEVNHKNGIKSDNRVENLEWVTKSENCQHAHSTGLYSEEGKSKMSRQGQEAWNKNQTKVSKEQIREMVKIYEAETISYKNLGKLFGISAFTTHNYIKNLVNKK
jgi:hypothetical protein